MKPFCVMSAVIGSLFNSQFYYFDTILEARQKQAELLVTLPAKYEVEIYHTDPWKKYKRNLVKLRS